MKQILFIRHAKSDWSVSGQEDFDRSLNERGCSDMPGVIQRVTERAIQLDQISSSPAVRARTTATILAEGLSLPEPDLIDSLYLAAQSDWLQVIHALPSSMNSVGLCGHNPGITEVVESFSSQRIGNLPTAGLALIQFDETSWSTIDWGSGKLAWLDYPKLH
ncbi:MAG: histidine phosphatase family protein [Verrucomicrobiota bacterium]